MNLDNIKKIESLCKQAEELRLKGCGFSSSYDEEAIQILRSEFCPGGSSFKKASAILATVLLKYMEKSGTYTLIFHIDAVDLLVADVINVSDPLLWPEFEQLLNAEYFFEYRSFKRSLINEDLALSLLLKAACIPDNRLFSTNLTEVSICLPKDLIEMADIVTSEIMHNYSISDEMIMKQLSALDKHMA